MVALNAMMEKLLEQHEERNRQSDVSATTSSFGVRASNTYFDAISKSKHIVVSYQTANIV